MGKSLRALWMALCVALPASVGCSGDRLVLGGVGGDSGCVPGTYAGFYDCSSDASFPAVLDASFGSAVGPIVFRLQGDVGGKMLYIAPDSKLAMDTMGIMSVVDLAGAVDCTSHKLTGQLKNITFTSSSFSGKVLQDGDLSADYNPNSSPPELDNGSMDFGAMSLGTIVVSSPVCSWYAKLQP